MSTRQERNFLKIFLTLLISMCFISSGIRQELDPLERPSKQPSEEKFINGLGSDFHKKFIRENGRPNNTAVIEDTWNSASEGFGLQGMFLSTLQALQIPHLGNINNVLTEIGLAAAVVQLSIDVYKGESYEGTLKFLKGYALYRMAKSSEKLLSAAALSISFIDYSITKYGSTAIQMRRTKWERTFYNYFDNSGMGGKLSYEEWKKLLKNAKTREDVETIAYDYLNKFWIEVDEDTLKHFVPPEYTDFIKQMPLPKAQKEITDYYFKHVLARELRGFLSRMTKEEKEDQYNAEMLKLRNLLNEWYTLLIIINGPDELLSKRLYYEFGPWTGRTNSKGLADFTFSLYSYLKADAPEKVTVVLSEKDRMTVKLPKCRWDNSFIINIDLLTKIDTSVLDKETNKPIPGAELVIRGQSFFNRSLIPEIKSIMPEKQKDFGGIPEEKYFCQKITSDKHGQLLLDNIPVGVYTITLSAKGYNLLKMEKVKFYKPRRKPLYLDPSFGFYGTKWQGKMIHKNGTMMYIDMAFNEDKAKPLKADLKLFYTPRRIKGQSTNFNASNFDLKKQILRFQAVFKGFRGKTFDFKGEFQDERFQEIKGYYYMKNKQLGRFVLKRWN